MKVRDRALALDTVIEAIKAECDNTVLYEDLAYLQGRVDELEDELEDALEDQLKDDQ